MYLVALHEERGRDGHTIWIAPSVGTGIYDLSADTRSKGLRELVDLDLLDPGRGPVTQTGFDERYRARNTYRLVPNGLDRIQGPTRAERLSRDNFATPPPPGRNHPRAAMHADDPFALDLD